MNLPTIIVIILIAAALAAIIISMIRNRKKGRTSCSCGGSCSGCAMSGSCHH